MMTMPICAAWRRQGRQNLTQNPEQTFLAVGTANCELTIYHLNNPQQRIWSRTSESAISALQSMDAPGREQ